MIANIILLKLVLYQMLVQGFIQYLVYSLFQTGKFLKIVLIISMCSFCFCYMIKCHFSLLCKTLTMHLKRFFLSLQTVYNYEKVVNCSAKAIQKMGVELNTSLPGTDLSKRICREK